MVVLERRKRGASMTQLHLPDPNPLGWWLMFNKGTDHEAAAARFEEKHGHAPARVWQDASNVFAGPAPERKKLMI